MNTLNRFKAPLVAALVLALPVLACSSVTDAQNAVCCTEYKAGATVDVNIGGSAESKVAVQAIADFQGVVNAGVIDLAAACRGIATDLGTAQTELDADAAKTGDTADATADAQMNAFCGSAVAAIKAQLAAGVTIAITVTPPVCSASLDAKADCEASCNGGVKCDFKANPPTCTGGSLTVACNGECDANAGATLNCTGSCSANCTGSCTVTGGASVTCAGKCDGTCSASAGGTGNGLDAQGNCMGECSGTCHVVAPNVKCGGSCSGSCSGSCMGSATASVTCDGTCKSDYKPISCTGGKLSGGCMADVKCSGNCNASVQAKASCSPAMISAVVTAPDPNLAGKIQATLEANLAAVYGFKARLAALGDIGGTLTANITAVVDIKAACIPVVVAATASAVTNLTDSLSVSASLVTSVGGS